MTLELNIIILGSMVFPESFKDNASRTIITGEVLNLLRRFKHVVNQIGRLTKTDSLELERFNKLFPDNHTKHAMR